MHLVKFESCGGMDLKQGHVLMLLLLLTSLSWEVVEPLDDWVYLEKVDHWEWAFEI